VRALFLALLAAITLQPTQHTTQNYIDESFDFLWSTFLGKAKPTELELYRLERARYRVWHDLCFEYRDISCLGMVPPKIESFNPNPLRPGLLGFYDGSDTIYVRSNLGGWDLEEVLAHEMSHYWDSEAGITEIPGPALDICFSEKRAWAVSDAFWLSKGYYEDSNKIVGAAWVNWYAHCTPHAHTLYPDIYPEE